MMGLERQLFPVEKPFFYFYSCQEIISYKKNDVKGKCDFPGFISNVSLLPYPHIQNE
jgi:hypothetical protein